MVQIFCKLLDWNNTEPFAAKIILIVILIVLAQVFSLEMVFWTILFTTHLLMAGNQKIETAIYFEFT